jgi:hypothetical protein
VALSVKLRLIEGVAPKDADKAAELAHQAVEEAGEALRVFATSHEGSTLRFSPIRA